MYTVDGWLLLQIKDLYFIKLNVAFVNDFFEEEEEEVITL